MAYLIPLRILRGHLPSRELLDRFPVLDDLFAPFVSAIRTGDIRAYDSALDRSERRLVDINLWLTLERARELCIRSLFRRVYVSIPTGLDSVRLITNGCSRTVQVGRIAKRNTNTTILVPLIAANSGHGRIPGRGGVLCRQHGLQGLHEGLYIAREADGCLGEYQCIPEASGPPITIRLPVLVLLGCNSLIPSLCHRGNVLSMGVAIVRPVQTDIRHYFMKSK